MDQLSSLIVYYLSQALGTLFEGDFSEKNLSLEISSGNLSLQNVQLKEQFFRDLPVGLDLSYGSIGKLDITIPWKSIGNEPLRVCLENVYILLKPCFAKDTQSSAARKSHQMKLAKLSSVDSLCRLREKSSSHSSTASFLFHYFKEKVARMIFNTLEFSIQNVHIRFEDQVSCSAALGGVCLGVTLESLHLRPACNSDRNSRSGRDRDSDREGGLGATQDLFRAADTLQQQCHIADLSVYCNELNIFSKNSCCVPFAGKFSEDIEKVMYSTIPRKSRLPLSHAYMLQPHDFSLRFGMNFSNGDVHIGIEVLSDDVTCEVEDVQIYNIISFVHFTNTYLNCNEFSEFRPDSAAEMDSAGVQTSRMGRRRRKMEDPAAWWRFAIQAVRRQLGHFSKLRFSAASLDKFFADKLVYTELWKCVLVNGCLTQEHSTQAFSQHSVIYVYNQLLTLSKRRRCLRNSARAGYVGRDVDLTNGDGVDLSYRQFTPVTDALLVQLEKRLSFESILLFRAMAEVEMEEDRKFNDPSWLKHLVLNTARGLLGEGLVGGEGGGKKKFEFIVDLLSTGALSSSSNGAGARGEEDMKPSGAAQHHRPSSSSALPRLRISTHVGIGAINVNLKLSPLAASPCSSSSPLHYSSATCPFFSLQSHQLHLLLEVDDGGAGLGGIPAVTCEVSLRDAAVLQRSPPPRAPICRSPPPRPHPHPDWLTHILFSRHRHSPPPDPPHASHTAAATHLPFTSPEQQQEQHELTALPLFLFSVQYRPPDSAAGNGTLPRVTFKGETSAVDICIAPACNELLRAFDVFAASLVPPLHPPKDLSAADEGYSGGRNNESRSNQQDGDTGTDDDSLPLKVDSKIKGTLDEASDYAASLMTFLNSEDSGVDLFADIHLGPIFAILSSESIHCESAAAAAAAATHDGGSSPFCAPLYDRHQPTSWTHSFVQQPSADECSEVETHQLIFNSGHVHMTIGEEEGRRRRGATSLDLLDIQIADMHACIATCWQGGMISQQQLLHPVGGRGRVELLLLPDVDTPPSALHASSSSASVSASMHLTDIAFTLSQEKIENVCLVLDAILNHISKNQLPCSASTDDDGQHKNKHHEDSVSISGEDDAFQDVLAVFESSESENGEDNDFYSLDSSSDDEDEDKQDYTTGLHNNDDSAHMDQMSSLHQLETLRDEMIMEIEFYEQEHVNLLTECRMRGLADDAIADELRRVNGNLRMLRRRYVDVVMRLDGLDSGAAGVGREEGGGYGVRARAALRTEQRDVVASLFTVNESYREGLVSFVGSLGASQNYNSVTTFSPQQQSAAMLKDDLRYILNFRLIDCHKRHSGNSTTHLKNDHEKMRSLGDLSLLSASFQVPLVSVELCVPIPDNEDVSFCRLELCQIEFLFEHKIEQLMLKYAVKDCCIYAVDIAVAGAVRPGAVRPGAADVASANVVVVKAVIPKAPPEPPRLQKQQWQQQHSPRRATSSPALHKKRSSASSSSSSSASSGACSDFLATTLGVKYTCVDKKEAYRAEILFGKLEVKNLQKNFMAQCYDVVNSFGESKVFREVGAMCDVPRREERAEKPDTGEGDDRHNVDPGSSSSINNFPGHDDVLRALSRYVLDQDIVVRVQHGGVMLVLPVPMGTLSPACKDKSEDEVKEQLSLLCFSVEAVSLHLRTASSSLLSDYKLHDISVFCLRPRPTPKSPASPLISLSPPSDNKIKINLLSFEKYKKDNCALSLSSVLSLSGQGKTMVALECVVDAKKAVLTGHLNVLSSLLLSSFSSLQCQHQHQRPPRPRTPCPPTLSVHTGRGECLPSGDRGNKSNEGESSSSSPILINLSECLSSLVECSTASLELKSNGVSCSICSENFDSNDNDGNNYGGTVGGALIGVEVGIKKLRGEMHWGAATATTTNTFEGIELAMLVEDVFVRLTHEDDCHGQYIGGSSSSSSSSSMIMNSARYLIHPFQVAFSGAALSCASARHLTMNKRVFSFHEQTQFNKEFFDHVVQQGNREISQQSADVAVCVSPMVTELDTEVAHLAGALAASSAVVVIPLLEVCGITSTGGDTSSSSSLHHATPSAEQEPAIGGGGGGGSGCGVAVATPFSFKSTLAIVEIRTTCSTVSPNPPINTTSSNSSNSSSCSSGSGSGSGSGSPLTEEGSGGEGLASPGPLYPPSPVAVHVSLRDIHLSGCISWAKSACVSADGHPQPQHSSLTLTVQASLASLECFLHHLPRGAAPPPLLVPFSGNILDALFLVSRNDDSDGNHSSSSSSKLCRLVVVYRDGDLATDMHLSCAHVLINTDNFSAVVRLGVTLANSMNSCSRKCDRVERDDSDGGSNNSKGKPARAPPARAQRSSHSPPKHPRPTRTFFLSTDTLTLPGLLHSVSFSCAARSCGMSVLDVSADHHRERREDGIGPGGLFASSDLSISSVLCSLTAEDLAGLTGSSSTKKRVDVWSTTMEVGLKRLCVSPDLQLDIMGCDQQQRASTGHKEIFLPFSASMVHTMFLETNEGGASINAVTASTCSNAQLIVKHEVDVTVEKKEAFFYLDFSVCQNIGREFMRFSKDAGSMLTCLRPPTVGLSSGDGDDVQEQEYLGPAMQREEVDANRDRGHSHSGLENIDVSGVADLMLYATELTSSLSCSVLDGGVSLTIINDVINHGVHPNSCPPDPLPLLRLLGPEVHLDLLVTRAGTGTGTRMGARGGDIGCPLSLPLNLNIDDESDQDVGLPLDVGGVEEVASEEGDICSYFQSLSPNIKLDYTIKFSKMSSSYYDPALLLWRAFVHSFDCTATASCSWLGWDVGAQRKGGQEDSMGLEKNVGGFSLDCNKNIDICITHSLVLCLNNLTASVESVLNPRQYPLLLSAFEVVNNSGMYLRVTSGGGRKSSRGIRGGDEQVLLILPPRAVQALAPALFATEPFSLAVATTDTTSRHEVGQITYSDIGMVSFADEMSVSYYESTSSQMCMFSVDTYLNVDTGSRVCEIRSSLVLRNSFPYVLQAQVITKQTRACIYSVDILPGESVFVPANLCASGDLFLQVVLPPPCRPPAAVTSSARGCRPSSRKKHDRHLPPEAAAVFSVPCPSPHSSSTHSLSRSYGYWLEKDSAEGGGRTAYLAVHATVKAAAPSQKTGNIRSSSSSSKHNTNNNTNTMEEWRKHEQALCDSLPFSGRTLTFSPPLSFFNHLATSIDILLVAGRFSTFVKYAASEAGATRGRGGSGGASAGGDVVRAVLAGDSLDFCDFACNGDVTLFFRLHPFFPSAAAPAAPATGSAALRGVHEASSLPWSHGVLVRGAELPCAEEDEGECRTPPTDRHRHRPKRNTDDDDDDDDDDNKEVPISTTTLSARGVWSNASELSVSVDVTYHRGGKRMLSLYVPFWIVTYSSAHKLLRYQANPIDDSKTEITLNGVDDLCAGQEFSPEIVFKGGEKESTDTSHALLSATPTWHVSSSMAAAMNNITAQMEADNELFVGEESSSPPPFNVMMCGHYSTTHVTDKCSLRLRIDDFPWSYPFDVTAAGSRLVAARSSSCRGVDVGSTVSSRLFGGSDSTLSHLKAFGSPATHDQTTEFVVKPCSTENIQTLFPKTKVLLVMDAFSVTNATDCVLKIRQFACASSTVTAFPRERVTLPWRDHKPRCLQVQLADDGLFPGGKSSSSGNSSSSDRGKGGAGVWSGKIVVSSSSDASLFQLKRHKEDTRALFMECSRLVSDRLQTHLVLRLLPDHFAPMLVENVSSSRCTINQVGSEECVVVEPRGAVPFAWDDNTLSHTLSIRVLGMESDEFFPLALVTIDDMSVRLLDDAEGGGRGGEIRVELCHSGPVTVVRLLQSVAPTTAASFASASSIATLPRLSNARPPRLSLSSSSSSSSSLYKGPSSLSSKHLLRLPEEEEEEEEEEDIGVDEQQNDVLGFPVAISIYSKGVTICIFDASLSHCLELRADSVTASCIHKVGNNLSLNAQVGHVSLGCVCYGGESGVRVGYDFLSSAGSHREGPPPSVLTPTCLFQPIFSGGQAAAARSVAVEDVADDDSVDADTVPFLRLQVDRNLAGSPGLVHISSAFVGIGSSALTVDETVLHALTPILKTTLCDVRVMAASTSVELMFVEAMRSLQWAMAAGSDTTSRRRQLQQVLLGHHHHCKSRPLTSSDLLSCRAQAAVSMTLLSAASVVSASQQACRGGGGEEPLYFVENLALSSPASVHLRAHMTPPWTVRRCGSLLTARGRGGGGGLFYKIMHLLVEPGCRLVCSAILEQCGGYLSLGGSEGVLLLGAGVAGASGRPGEVLTAVASSAVHTFMQTVVAKHFFHPLQVVSNFFHFSYSFGRCLLFTSISILRSPFVALTQPTVSDSTCEGGKICCSHIDELNCRGGLSQYYFDIFCCDETMHCYFFANSINILIGMCDVQLDLLSPFRQILLRDIVEVSTTTSSSAAFPACLKEEDEETESEAEEWADLIDLLTVVVDDSPENSAAKKISNEQVARTTLLSFYCSNEFTVVLKCSGTAGADFSFDMSRNKYGYLIKFLKQQLPQQTIFTHNLCHSK